VVYDQVVGDAHHPGQKLTLFAIRTFFKGFDDLDKGILKNIFRDVPVQYFGIDKTADTLVVAVDQDFKGFFISADVIAY
jgi:hypothetical protein